MQVFFFIAYFVVGLVQLFAIADGVSYALGMQGFLSFLIAIFTTYLPLIGSVLGVYGAINVWDWSWVQAGTLFFWYIPVGIAFAVISSLFDRK